MNNADDQSSEDSQTFLTRVRLLTFDWLPFTDDLSASESVYEAMDSLSADGVFFENHYLQKAGFRGVTDGFSLSKGDGDIRNRLLLFGSGTEPAIDVDSLPELLNPELRLSLAELSDLPDDDFCWLHFEAAPEEAGGGEFETVLPLIQSLLEQRCVVFVTALSGKAQPPGRFESLLAESLIRAPLWMLGTGEDSGRVQAVTGSCDVGYSIQQLVKQGASEAGVKSQPGQEPVDLMELCVGPGQLLNREVLIERDCVRAIRCNDFLLVDRPPSVDAELVERRTALYAKPEDVWNLNDVAGEYQAVADGLNQRLESRFVSTD